MKIIYRIYNDWTKEQVQLLASHGIKVELGADRFDIEENDTYKQLEPFLDKWNVHKSVGTIYDKSDIKESKLLVYTSVWVNGYPQPEDINGYLNLTYNTDHYCPECGIGAIQKAPFRIKKEPKWVEKKMFELTWVLDEIFVQKDVYNTYFKKMGIECMPVMLYKKDTVIENTVQLKIPVIDIPLLLKDQPFQVCKTCRRKKYSPKINGFFPSFERDVPKSFQIFKSSEFFGSEVAADRRIFITIDMYRQLESLKINPNVWAVR